MQPTARQVRIASYQMIGFQLLVASVMMLVFFQLQGAQAAYSALQGGLIAALPNLVFALFAFRYLTQGSAEQARKSFMRGHALKILLTIALFIGVMRQDDVVASALIISYTITLLAQWSAVFFFKH
ncbi:MAG: ATP synthase subunit I [Alkalimonas sp.]|uniref:ATP synthase subunit I n=1 Tax=Alkalimonas delamerensis TaxID=265981 RepID=A0ABT9GT79_9GAMM|nr:ATP synthase subunit I [Alkalimonas delamerensis]MCC5851759.1 ATP synthase subunit I [Alkalimonas sp.]MDP4530179.1 ATP synthase subunit I [Alkalimonas delamerensis]